MLDDIAFAVIRSTYRLPRGGTRIARTLAKLRPNLRQFPVRTRYGTIVCDLNETVCLGLAVDGEVRHWRLDEAALANIPLDRSSVVLDVGANIGVMTRIFAERAGHVHAFEPAPRALALLRANLPRNATIHATAVGAEPGTIRFAEREALDMSGVSPEGMEVPVVTIDSLGLAPTLIKIDVEGYEPEVLKGAQETIAAHSPYIMFEALDSSTLDTCSRLISGANPSYRINDMGSGMNFLAVPER